MADEVAQEADALAAIRDVSWVWHDSTAREDAVAWFRGAGLEDIADDLASYEGGPDHPPEQLVARFRSALDDADVDEATRKDATAMLDRVEEAFRTAPQVLERARRLVRHAARLAETDLCRGRERKEAADAIGRAIHAYDEARTAVTTGAAAQARSKVRSMVEWASLAAAKAARSCAAGQLSLSPTPSASHAEETLTTPAPPPSGRRRRAKAAPDAAPRPRGRRRKAEAAPEAVDAEKDKLLLDAFRDAVAAAMNDVSPS